MKALIFPINLIKKPIKAENSVLPAFEKYRQVAFKISSHGYDKQDEVFRRI